MNLTEIYAKLPIAHANVLDKYLDEVSLPVEPTREDVVKAAQEAVDKTLRQLGTILLEHGQLLNEVPEAAADLAFA